MCRSLCRPGSKSSITSAAGFAGLGEKALWITTTTRALFFFFPPCSLPPPLPPIPPSLPTNSIRHRNTHATLCEYACVERTESQDIDTHTHTSVVIGRQCRGHVACPSPNGRWSPPPVICSSPHRLSTGTSTRHHPATRPAARKEERPPPPFFQKSEE